MAFERLPKTLSQQLLVSVQHIKTRQPQKQQQRAAEIPTGRFENGNAQLQNPLENYPHSINADWATQSTNGGR